MDKENAINKGAERTQPKARIMVVDDENIALKNLRRILENSGYQVVAHSNPLRALERLKDYPCDLVISDIRMPEMDGLTFLEKVKRAHPTMEIILMTGYASINGAVEATKEGAFHYLQKPFTPDEVRSVVHDALKRTIVKKQAADLARHHDGSVPLLIGNSPGMQDVVELIQQIAPTECSVLITGESGTGKELAARAVHTSSSRANGPFTAFNCAAFNEELLDNELFGHEKEAFTGALTAKPGLLETAAKGTLFLDEVGEMPSTMQVKLLRVIQERELIRVGGVRAIPIDVRIIGATSQDLKEAVREGTFRQDLFFRLNVVTIHMPSLKERKEDIPLLAYHFFKRFREQMNKKIDGISEGALGLLSNYAFPGNVRELENIIERAVALCRGDTIHSHDLPQDLVDLELHVYPLPNNSFLRLEELEKDYIRHILKITGGNRAGAAQILGIDRTSLWRKIKKYGLP